MRPNYQELYPDPMRVTIDRTFRVDIPIVLDFGYALRVGVCLFSNQASPRIPVDLRTREDLDPEKAPYSPSRRIRDRVGVFQIVPFLVLH